MRLACHYLGVFAIAYATLALPSPGASVNLNLTTSHLSSGGETQVDIYDGSGVHLGSLTCPANTTEASTEVSVATDLPPGRYSFAISPLQTTHWTHLVGVSSNGVSSSIGLEAFPEVVVPLDPTTPIDGNLLVEGSIDMRGRVFNMGTNPTAENLPAFSLRTDLNGGSLFNSSTSNSPFWYWGIAYDGNQFHGLMRLEGTLFGDNAALYVGDSRVLTAANASSLFTASRLSIGTGVSASGTNSFASGNTVSASGTHSGAFGLGTTAQGYNQFVVGQFNAPLGTSEVNTNSDDPLFIVGNGFNNGARSNAFVVERDGDTRIAGSLTAGVGALNQGGVVAIGPAARALGADAVAIGRNARGTGPDDVALGTNAFAFAGGATALGAGARATHPGAVALGPGTFTVADNALTFGPGTLADARGSVALGEGLDAETRNQFVVGRFNMPTGDPGSERPDDDLFIVGNGTDNANRSNAVAVKRNGDVNVAGKLRVWPSGDLSMGTFKSGTKPNVGVDPDPS
jgi:hypothetical protein